MNIRKLSEGHAAALWRLRLPALDTDPLAFAESPDSPVDENLMTLEFEEISE